MSASPGDAIGGFELERKLGVGGMATVWLAHPTAPGVPFARVVVKLLHGHLAEQAQVRALFMEEARLARGLEHPNVVRVFDCGSPDGDCYIAMEYIDGVDLRSAMAAHGGPLWPALAASLVADACKGLHYAHRRGVVHRDVSPDNLMVDRRGQVRLVDFGVARATSTELTTKTGLRKGKVRYMSPEYISEHVATPASDVYAMGLALHELLTGQAPFGDVVGVAEVHAAIMTRGVKRADLLRPSLPKQLVDVVARATARKPADRTAGAGHLELELRAFLERFHPPSAAEIGEEVAVWKQKLAAGPLRAERREHGSFGQLESTELLELEALGPLPRRPAAAGPPTVLVAHQLDLTEVDFPVAAPAWDDATDPSAHLEAESPTGPIDGQPSVVLVPELEAVAVRTRSARRKKSSKKKRVPARKKR